VLQGGGCWRSRWIRRADGRLANCSKKDRFMNSRRRELYVNSRKTEPAAWSRQPLKIEQLGWPLAKLPCLRPSNSI
jgi:hypothetical protein